MNQHESNIFWFSIDELPRNIPFQSLLTHKPAEEDKRFTAHKSRYTCLILDFLHNTTRGDVQALCAWIRNATTTNEDGDGCWRSSRSRRPVNHNFIPPTTIALSPLLLVAALAQVVYCKADRDWSGCLCIGTYPSPSTAELSVTNKENSTAFHPHYTH